MHMAIVMRMTLVCDKDDDGGCYIVVLVMAKMMAK